jgi:hypothetical protein
MRKALAMLCLLGCLGCLVVFFWFHQETKDEGRTKTAHWTMGLRSSPWLVSTTEDRTIEEKDGIRKVHTAKQEPKYLSASWLFLLGAVVLWNVFRHLRRGTLPR